MVEQATTEQQLDSIERYEETLAAGLPSESAPIAINRAYRRLIPRWHFAMLNDERRNAAFRAALQAVVRPEHVVLDVGTGTGLLAMMAARAGARVVVSCEAIAPIAHMARRIVDANGLGGRVDVVAKPSFDLRVGRDLPARADVLVTETIDCGLLGESVLSIVRHARQHLLRGGARVIPARARVLFRLIESRAIHRNNFARDAAGLDVSLFNRFSTREHFPVRLSTWDHRPLSAATPLFDFDFQDGSLASRRACIGVEAEQGGWVHGIVFWFELELSPGVHLSNAPDNTDGHWMQAVHCFERPVLIERGTPVVVRAAHDETGFQFSLHPHGAQKGAEEE